MRGVSDTFLTQVITAVDNIDGDQLVIDWTPTNYIPSTLPPEADALTQLTAHLSGNDSAFAGAIVGAVPTIVADIASRDDSSCWRAGIRSRGLGGCHSSIRIRYVPLGGASWLKASTSDTSSDNLPLVASAGSTAATSVDGALLDLFGNDADFRSVQGVIDGATNLGTFTGVTIPDGSDLLTALQALETAVEGVVAGGASGFVVTNIADRDARGAYHRRFCLCPGCLCGCHRRFGVRPTRLEWCSSVSRFQTLRPKPKPKLNAHSGTAIGDTDLGSFTGATIADGSTITVALQALETAVEAVAPGNTTSIVANIAARDALTPTTGDFSHVTDASADATVSSGTVEFQRSGPWHSAR